MLAFVFTKNPVGDLKFLILLSLGLVTTPTEKMGYTGYLESSMLPISKSYKVSSMHNASV